MTFSLKKSIQLWPFMLPVLVVTVAVVLNLRSEKSPRESQPFRRKTQENRSPESVGRDSTNLHRARLLQPTNPAEAFRLLSEIEPNSSAYTDARKEMVRILLGQNQQSEAAEILSDLALANPEDVKLRRALVEMYFDLEEYRNALPHARAWVRLQPDLENANIVLAEVFAELNRPADMVPPLTRALKLSPQSWELNTLLAYAFVEMGDMAAADRYVTWCLAERPDDVISLRLKGELLRANGEIDEALKRVRRALTVDASDVECRILECDLLLYLGQAEAAFRSLLPLFDDYTDSRAYLGSFLRAARMSGHDEEARSAQEKLLELLTTADESALGEK